MYTHVSLGVNNDDIVLSTTQCSDLPILCEEAIISEKLDGGNCSIYQGKVWYILTPVNNEKPHSHIFSLVNHLYEAT